MPDSPTDRPVSPPDAPTERRRYGTALAVLVVGVIAAVISFIGSWTAPAGIDEAATMSSARRSLRALWHMAHNVDGVHSTYYAIMHVWFEVVPYDFVTLRLPSAIAVGVGAGLLVLLGKHLASTRSGVMAGLVFAVLPRVTSSGLQGRSYAMSMALAAAVTLVLVIATDQTIQRRSRAWIWWAGYAVLAVLGSYLFLYSALVIVAHGLTMLIWQITRRRRGATVRAGVSWVIAAAVAAVLVLPLVRMTSGQASTQLYWMGAVLRVNRKLAKSVVVEQYFGESTKLAALCVLIALVGLVAVLLVRRLRPWAAAYEVALPAIIVPTAAVIVVSVVVQPLYNARYLTFTTPFVALLVGVALAAVRWRFTDVLVVALIAVLCFPMIAQQRASQGKTGTHWHDVSAYISAERGRLPDDGGADGIYYGPLPRHTIRTTEYVSSSYPNAFEGMRDLTITRTAAVVGQLWAERLPAEATPPLDGIDRVWYVGAQTSVQPAALQAQLEAQGWKQESRKEIYDFSVITFTR